MPNLNFTNRRKIKQADIEIKIREDSTGSIDFIASLNLSDYNFPLDAKVVVEAYRQTAWMRFDFGTIGRVSLPDNTLLTSFGSPEAVLFRIKVIGNGAECKLLGLAKEVRPVRSDSVANDKIPLLPVCYMPLGNVIWDIDFTNEPQLKINSSLENYRSISNSPVFSALVFPTLLKDILQRILIIDNDDAEEGWQANWIKFAENLPGISSHPTIDDDPSNKYEWIDEVVNTFSRTKQLLDLFQANWGDNQ